MCRNYETIMIYSFEILWIIFTFAIIQIRDTLIIRIIKGEIGIAGLNQLRLFRRSAADFLRIFLSLGRV